MPEMAAAIVAENANKLFLDGAVVAFHQLTLSVERNEILCVVGPSGCGKTTLLRCIAGLTELSDGRILVHGTPVMGRPPPGRERTRAPASHLGPSEIRAGPFAGGLPPTGPNRPAG